jgi:ribosomal protein L11 methyltransferase
MTPERWLELRVRSSAVPPDVLVEVLLGLGGRAVREEEGWQVTHLPDPETPGGADELVSELREALGSADGKDLEVATRWQAHEDWAELWKQGLGARRITPRLLVAPSWVDSVPQGEEHVLVLDPGMAFGTAEHGTTRGCLRLLDHAVRPGDRVLDVGAGSGILGIAATLIGAASVLGMEMDEWAVDAARENALRNGVAEQVTLRRLQVTSEVLATEGGWDGVVANMEVGRLRPLLSGLVDAARPGGWIILSGILEDEFDAVREETVRRGATLERFDADGEWRSALFLRQVPTSG